MEQFRGRVRNLHMARQRERGTLEKIAAGWLVLAIIFAILAVLVRFVLTIPH